MNEHFRRRTEPDAPVTTQAAEGLPRRCWTVEDIEAIVEAGIISPDERFELIGGEAVPMSHKGYRHERVKNALARHFMVAVKPPLDVAIETTMRLGDQSLFEPDIAIVEVPSGASAYQIDQARLVIEVADTSLAYDTERKAAVYAAFGLKELWVVNAVSLVTTVFRGPGDAGYASMTEVGPDTELRPLFDPGLACRLGDLRLA